MSDIEQIFWVLVALTLAFGTVWLRPGGVLFVSPWGGRYRPRWLFGRAAIQNDHGGLLMGNVLPFGSAVVAAPWPLTVSPTGVLAVSPAAPTPDGRADASGRYVAFTGLRSATNDGKTLLVNGRPFLTAQSKTLAARWGRWLTELKGLAEEERGAWIERALATSCELGAAQTAIQTSREKARWVRRLSTMLFGYCYLMLGLAAFGNETIPFQPAIQMYLAIVLLTYLALRWTTDSAGPDEPAAGHSWMILISPVDAFRAADQIVRPALEVFHPLVLARLLAGETARAELERRVALDILYPLPAERPADPRAAETAIWFADRMRQAVWGAFHTLDIDPHRYDTRPQPDDATSLGYCPRCAGQFVRDAGTCSVCGVPLRSFAAPLLPPPPWPANVSRGPAPVVTPTPKSGPSSPPPAAKPQPSRRRSKRKR